MLLLNQSVHSLRKYSKCTNLFYSLSYAECDNMQAYDIPLKTITTPCIATFLYFLPLDTVILNERMSIGGHFISVMTQHRHILY